MDTTDGSKLQQFYFTDQTAKVNSTHKSLACIYYTAYMYDTQINTCLEKKKKKIFLELHSNSSRLKGSKFWGKSSYEFITMHTTRCLQTLRKIGI